MTPASRFDSFFIFSDPVEIEPVQRRIASAMQARRYSVPDILGVRLALEEALVNAIRHGNEQQIARKVHVAFQVDDDQVWIEIEDEGDGFCPAEVADPTRPDALERPGGRGILLMQSSMNQVLFNDRGNRVRMCKVRTDAGTQSPVER